MKLPRQVLLFQRATAREARAVAQALRTETIGGAVLLAAAGLALAWANSPWRDAYADLREVRVGPAAWHLDLSLGQWAADGLLAVFFFVAGAELRRETVVGDLADRAKAVVPVTAALAGVLTPATLYAVTVWLRGDPQALGGWAIPTATDIAFALAVLAVMGSHLPGSLRSFLLTLAVVDDLVAITIIAVVYSESLSLGYLSGGLAAIVLFGWLLRRGITHPAVLALPAALAWYLVHEGGVHATVAGVLLGLAVPVSGDGDESSGPTVAERIEHAVRPFSAGVAVPVFAFFAAGVGIGGAGLGPALRDPVVTGIVVGLLFGKSIGVFAGTWLVARFTRARLDESLSWWDVLGVALLSGIGFTVSLLIGELAFGTGSEREDHVRIAVLLASLLAAGCAALVLRVRERHYRLAGERDDHAGAEDVARRGQPG
ncbi:MAG: Na+/H+ antiporter NhaA [Dermatophilaceae bacterium]